MNDGMKGYLWHTRQVNLDNERDTAFERGGEDYEANLICDPQNRDYSDQLAQDYEDGWHTQAQKKLKELEGDGFPE